MASLTNALTVDVEDYYHVSAFEDQIDRNHWGDFESRVVQNVERLLELLARHEVHGTFFVLGWIAERFPHLVERISAAGHEIGSHSHWHRLIYRQSPEEFRADLVRSRDTLADLVGQPVTSYRAPSFSITRKSYWALEILVEEGFQVDSSIFPIYHDRYGIPDAPRDLHQLETAAGKIWEFPVSVRRFAGLNFPVSGGGYFRLYPLGWTTRCLRRINQQLGEPFVFYVHPWEIDPQQPRLPHGSRLSRMRHYVNLSTTENKLSRLLEQFRFGRIRDVVAERSGLPLQTEPRQAARHEHSN